MKTAFIQITAAFLLLPFFLTTVQAQESNPKKLVIIKKTVDETGAVVTEKIVKKGQAAEGFDLDKFLEENKENGSVNVDIEAEGDVRIRVVDRDMVPGSSDRGQFSIGHCNNNRGYMGINRDQDENPDDAGIVLDVYRGSGAYQAGLRNNDVLYSINGKTIGKWSDVSAILANTKPGEKVKVVYAHLGKVQHAEVTLTTERESNCSCNQCKKGFLGVKGTYDDDPVISGQCISVVANSGAQTAGIKDRDIITKLNETAIKDWEDIEDFMSETEPGQTVQVGISREGKALTIASVLTESEEYNPDYKPGGRCDENSRTSEMNNFDFEALDPLFHTLYNRKNEVKEACLGVYSSTYNENGQKGAKVSGFMAESGAQEAGLLENDLITLVNDAEITSHSTLWDKIATYKPGEEVTVSVLRDNQPKTFKATLKACKTEQIVEDRIIVKEENECTDKDPFLGVVSGFNDNISILDGEAVIDRESAQKPGFYIGGINASSAAQEAGLKEGDIITQIENRNIADFNDLRTAIRQFKPGDKIVIHYLRHGKQSQTVATLKSCAETNKNTVGESAPMRMLRAPFKRMEKNKVIVIRKQKGTEAPKEVEAPAPAAKERTLQLTDFRVFPNPTEGPATLEFNAEPVPTTITLLDLSGKQLYREELNAFNGAYSQSFDLNEYAKGTIVIAIQQGDKIFTEQVIVK